jgi:RNA polymerase sigma-70 factor (ECF subfamily)
VADDIELARRSGRGDTVAFRALVERHARYLYGVAYALSGNAADAEDLVQESLAGAWNGKFRGESSVRTWLVQILVRRAAMLRRSRRRHGPPVSLDGGLADEAGFEAGGPTGASAATARLDLATMLASLSDEHRAVVVLRELEGMSYQEMARTLGIPQGTVESRLYRAREELRRRYAGYL